MKKVIKQLIKNTTATILFIAAALPAAGQDLLARQAPIDKKMRAVDSVSIQRLLEREHKDDIVSTLYPDWEADFINRYSSVSLPQEVKIDLRNFCMPINSRIVTSNFGYRKRFRRQHKGIDVNAYKGDTIRAAFDGKVRVVDYQPSGYGKVVVMRHPNGLETVYAHLSKHLIEQGAEIKAGTPIGLAGNTGRSYGTHLHFETRLGGQFINPALLFDFEAQDVKGDFYVWRKHGRGSILDSHQGVVSNDLLAANENEEEEIDETSSNQNEQQASGYRFHKVRKGESLYSIARKHGISLSRLCKINGISKRMKIRPGQILKYS
ncbi:MAG: peptidoglycan DD-metalloendopeptidase family protein [Bacteroidaceae bacterium]|nr:peptidoglycan DD-metalloendopeptidase family protein [Bacteroidaceae bacterium]